MATDHHTDLQLLSTYMGFSPQPSDREFAIVCASYVEKHVGNLLGQEMSGANGDLRKKLLGSDGALGSAAARFDMARALDLIGQREYKDMITMSRIRNRFAHNIDIDSFDHPQIAKLVSELKYHTTSGFKDDWPKYSNRYKLYYTAWSMCGLLHQKLGGIGDQPDAQHSGEASE